MQGCCSHVGEATLGGCPQVGLKDKRLAKGYGKEELQITIVCEYELLWGKHNRGKKNKKEVEERSGALVQERHCLEKEL
jgi:hypothetical protein